MKKYNVLKSVLLLLICVCNLKTFAQVGIGTSSPAASAKLEVSSTTQGFLPPRMTTTERDAIASPATGLVIFNTTTNGLEIRTSSAWVKLVVPTDNAANVTGTVAVANGGTGLTSVTSGLIPFGNGTSALGTSSNLAWNNSTSSLGVGTSTPGNGFNTNLDVIGSTSFRTNSANIGLKFDGYSPSGSLQVSRIYTDATSGTPGDFILGTYPNGHLNQLYLKQSNGFVGIGTTSPATALDVNGTVTATSINVTGNLTASGTIRSTSAGQILNMKMVKPTVAANVVGITLGNTTTNWTDIATVTYTPVSNNSTIIIEFNTFYYLAGTADDVWATRILAGSSEVAYLEQKWINGSGGGTRGGTLLPIMGGYTNSALTDLVIKIQGKEGTGGSDDGVTFDLRENYAWFKITEIAR